MNRVFSVSALIGMLMLLISCAAPAVKTDSRAMPEWAATGDTSRYPSEFYITGVGSAQVRYGDTAAAQSKADSRAMAQVAKQIEVVIQQQTSSFEREVSSGGQPLNQRDIWEKTAAYVQIKIEGVRIEKRHLNQTGKRMYSLALFDRAAQGQIVSQEITALKSNAAALTAEAERQQHSPETVYRAATAYGLAIQKLILALRKNQYLGVIAPQMVHTDITGALASLQADVTAFMSRFQLMIIGGDHQHGRVGGHLAEPLEVKITYQRQPAPSVPVYFDFAKGSGAIDSRARSNAAGIAATRVTHLGPTGQKVNKIIAAIDIYPSSSEIRRELAQVIPPVSDRFTYQLPPLEEIRVAVIINDYNLGYRQADSYTQNQVRQTISDYKLALVKDIPPAYQLDDYDVAGGPRLAEKLKALTAVADIALVGEVRSTLLDSSSASGLVVTRARAVVKFLELATGREMGNVDISLKAAGPSRDEAGRRNLRQVAGAAAQQVEKEIKRIFLGE